MNQYTTTILGIAQKISSYIPDKAKLSSDLVICVCEHIVWP